jgi:hypothetical protein
MNLLYVRPDEMFTLYQSVTGSVINGTYSLDWLVDGLPGRPLRAGTNNPSWGITGPAKDVNFLCLISTNLDAGKVVNITGDVTDTLTQPNYLGRIPVNPFKHFTPAVSVDNLTVALASANTIDVIVGQFVAGKARELERPIQPMGRRSHLRYNAAADQTMGNIAVTRKEKGGRKFSGVTTVTPAGLLAIQEWFYSTNDGEQMSIIVPAPELNDAWAVKFDGEPVEERMNINNYRVTINLTEIPRKRWT